MPESYDQRNSEYGCKTSNSLDPSRSSCVYTPKRHTISEFWAQVSLALTLII